MNIFGGGDDADDNGLGFMLASNGSKAADRKSNVKPPAEQKNEGGGGLLAAMEDDDGEDFFAGYGVDDLDADDAPPPSKLPPKPTASNRGLFSGMNGMERKAHNNAAVIGDSCVEHPGHNTDTSNPDNTTATDEQPSDMQAEQPAGGQVPTVTKRQLQEPLESASTHSGDAAAAVADMQGQQQAPAAGSSILFNASILPGAAAEHENDAVVEQSAAAAGDTGSTAGDIKVETAQDMGGDMAHQTNDDASDHGGSMAPEAQAPDAEMQSDVITTAPLGAATDAQTLLTTAANGTPVTDPTPAGGKAHAAETALNDAMHTGSATTGSATTAAATLCVDRPLQDQPIYEGQLQKGVELVVDAAKAAQAISKPAATEEASASDKTVTGVPVLVTDVCTVDIAAIDTAAESATNTAAAAAETAHQFTGTPENVPVISTRPTAATVPVATAAARDDTTAMPVPANTPQQGDAAAEAIETADKDSPAAVTADATAAAPPAVPITATPSTADASSSGSAAKGAAKLATPIPVTKGPMTPMNTSTAPAPAIIAPITKPLASPGNVVANTAVVGTAAVGVIAAAAGAAVKSAGILSSAATPAAASGSTSWGAAPPPAAASAKQQTHPAPATAAVKAAPNNPIISFSAGGPFAARQQPAKPTGALPFTTAGTTVARPVANAVGTGSSSSFGKGLAAGKLFTGPFAANRFQASAGKPLSISNGSGTATGCGNRGSPVVAKTVAMMLTPSGTGTVQAAAAAAGQGQAIATTRQLGEKGSGSAQPMAVDTIPSMVQTVGVDCAAVGAIGTPLPPVGVNLSFRRRSSGSIGAPQASHTPGDTVMAAATPAPTAIASAAAANTAMVKPAAALEVSRHASTSPAAAGLHEQLLDVAGVTPPSAAVGDAAAAAAGVGSMQQTSGTVHGGSIDENDGDLPPPASKMLQEPAKRLEELRLSSRMLIDRVAEVRVQLAILSNRQVRLDNPMLEARIKRLKVTIAEHAEVVKTQQGQRQEQMQQQEQQKQAVQGAY